MHYVYHFFFFNDTATTEIYTLSLHDALPISDDHAAMCAAARERSLGHVLDIVPKDRKSTRLNSSHLVISYAVFCLKKKKKAAYQLNENGVYTSSLSTSDELPGHRGRTSPLPF